MAGLRRVIDLEIPHRALARVRPARRDPHPAIAHHHRGPPCHEDDVVAPSQQICASSCVCALTLPGVINWPSALIVLRMVPDRAPVSTISPFTTRLSGVTGSMNVNGHATPVATVAPFRHGRRILGQQCDSPIECLREPDLGQAITTSACNISRRLQRKAIETDSFVALRTFVERQILIYFLLSYASVLFR